MVIGHVYYFLEDIFPNQPGGRRILATPQFLRNICDPSPEVSIIEAAISLPHHSSYETSVIPHQRSVLLRPNILVTSQFLRNICDPSSEVSIIEAQYPCHITVPSKHLWSLTRGQYYWGPISLSHHLRNITDPSPEVSTYLGAHITCSLQRTRLKSTEFLPSR